MFCICHHTTELLDSPHRASNQTAQPMLLCLVECSLQT
jgi:hypothetical protein